MMNLRNYLAPYVSALALTVSAACGSSPSSVPADPICDATFDISYRFSMPWDGTPLPIGIGPFKLEKSSFLDPYTNELVGEVPTGWEYVDDRRGGIVRFEPAPLELKCCDNTVSVRAGTGYVTLISSRRQGMNSDNGLVIGGSVADFERVYPNAVRSTSSPYDIRISDHVKVLVKEGAIDSLAASSYQFFSETAFGEPSIPPGPDGTSAAWYGS